MKASFQKQASRIGPRSEEHTSELQSRRDIVCRLLLEKKKKRTRSSPSALKKTTGARSRGERGRPSRCPRVCIACAFVSRIVIFCFTVAGPTKICTLSLHDALPN